MNTKIEVELKYAPKVLAQASDIMAMAGMDLGIDGLFTTDRMTFETSTKVDATYIENLKKALKTGIKSDGGKLHEVIIKIIS